jgi:hypothetical protein
MFRGMNVNSGIPYLHVSSYYASYPDETVEYSKRHPLLFSLENYRVSGIMQDNSGEIERIHSLFVELSRMPGGESLLEKYGVSLKMKDHWRGKKKKRKKGEK